jgi:hypothetical protein
LRSDQANSSRDPHLQNNQSKMDWRYVTQLVEHLLCKYKALNSNPSPILKNRWGSKEPTKNCPNTRESPDWCWPSPRVPWDNRGSPLPGGDWSAHSPSRSRKWSAALGPCCLSPQLKKVFAQINLHREALFPRQSQHFILSVCD